MTKIEIEIAKTLNGSTPYMAAILVDSYGDKLLVSMSPDSSIHADQYFTPCNCCDVPVLDSSIGTDGHGVCDHCAVTPRSCTATNHEPCMTCDYDDGCTRQEHGFKSKGADMETRIKEATELADSAFWKTIAERFPEAKTGDFQMSYDPEPLVRHWVDMNVPKVAEPWATKLGLHYYLSWRMLYTGGGVMVAVTLPTRDGYYIGVSSDCVILYQRKTDAWLEEDTDIEDWTYGNNPTKLLAMIEEHLSSTYDPNQLFDDIMTVGKSDQV